MQLPSGPHSPRAEQPLGHAGCGEGTLQSTPAKPTSHSHQPSSWQRPWPPQLCRHASGTTRAHDAPAKPASHRHRPSWPHRPCPEHEDGQCATTTSLHRLPVKPGWQSETPQVPWPDRPASHTLSSQNSPLTPCGQLHVPFAQVPPLTHGRFAAIHAQDRCSHRSPEKASSQSQRPSIHTPPMQSPCPPQPRRARTAGRRQSIPLAQDSERNAPHTTRLAIHDCMRPGWVGLRLPDQDVSSPNPSPTQT